VEAKPSVSVIVPCYNGSAFLRDTLDSALRQTHPPLEVIVVDDGSTDDSAAIAASYGPPVRIIRQENRGVSAARNRGLAEARGNYLVFLDADDLLEATTLARQCDAVRDLGGGVAWVGCAWFDEDPARPYREVRPWVTSFFPELLRTNLGVPCQWLFPRDLADLAGGFSANMRISADWDFLCKIAVAGGVLVPVDHVGAYYRKHPASMTATMRDVDHAREHVTLIEALCMGLLEQPELLERYGSPLFWCGYTAIDRARQRGIAWGELQGLGGLLAEVARRGPGDLRKSKIVRLVRLTGFRWAQTLRRALLPTKETGGETQNRQGTYAPS
jgi:hypothetical protein